MAEEVPSASIEQQDEQPPNEIKQDSPYLTTTESKQDMAIALTSLISTFKDETEQQDQILLQLQNESTNNPNFGKQSHVSQWTVNEVCYWLTTIDLLDYTHIFYSSKIDGNILLNDINQNLLTNDLNVKPIHCSKILREIDNLKKVMSTESDTNLNDIIATIKKENEVLLSELEKQKTLNAELSSNKTTDFHSIPNNNNNNIEHINNGKTKTKPTTKSLSTIVESQNTMILDLTSQLELLQDTTHKKIKELKQKNKKLQDGYINIETHYQTQLEHSRTKSKNLQAQLKNINNNENDWNNNVSLLWNENENTAKDLENEKEKRMMLEISLKNTQLSLNNERQKRKLLESQTSRLTAELTKYLTSIDNKPTNNNNNTNTNTNSKKERFSRFKGIKKRKNTNENIQSNQTNNTNTETIDSKTGWQRFLDKAGSVSHKIKNKDKDTKTSKSFHLPKRLSLTNIQQKLRKKSENNDINNIIEQKEISEDIEMDIDEINRNNNKNNNEKQTHVRKVTLGETVIKTFKKIQSATKAKMEERAIKKQTKKQSMDSIKESDRFCINGHVDEINQDLNGNTVSNNDNKINVLNEDLNGDININDENKVNIGIDDDSEYEIDDEDSSAAEQEYRMRKKKISEKHTKIIITKPNRKNVIDEMDSDDSIIIKRDDGTISPTNMDIQFKPAMEVLKQTTEQEIDTDASF